jgi:hypothetical protein
MERRFSIFSLPSPLLLSGPRFLPFSPSHPFPLIMLCSSLPLPLSFSLPLPPRLAPPPLFSASTPLSSLPQGKDGKIVWEQPSKWLVRMNKIIGTYAIVIINNSENPLNFKDGWLWLSKLVNYCVR